MKTIKNERKMCCSEIMSYKQMNLNQAIGRRNNRTKKCFHPQNVQCSTVELKKKIDGSIECV